VMLTHDFINKFYAATVNTKEKHLIAPFHKALMALMLAANPHNLAHQLPIKSCFDYFRDFQKFFRQCLSSKEYQHIMAYPYENESPVFPAMISLIHEIVKVLYIDLNEYNSINPQIHYAIGRALSDQAAADKTIPSEKKQGGISERLHKEYQAMIKALKRSAHRPLQKTLENVEEEGNSSFDPFIQDNLPTQLYSLYVQDMKFNFARWPSPTVQEYINKAEMIEEFKTMIRGVSQKEEGQKNLIFNFQDRTLWRDYCRCEVLEGVSKDPSMANTLSLVTFAKDTEFYNQNSPYNQENQADSFMRHLKLQLSDKLGGFYFPKEIQKMILNDFSDEAIKGIHRVFFSEKKCS